MDRKRADRRRLLWMLVGALIGVIVVAVLVGLWVNRG
jgi:predicted nucleic acid-binding Zn ribbon protein